MKKFKETMEIPSETEFLRPVKREERIEKSAIYDIMKFGKNIIKNDKLRNWRSLNAFISISTGLDPQDDQFKYFLKLYQDLFMHHFAKYLKSVEMGKKEQKLMFVDKLIK